MRIVPAALAGLSLFLLAADVSPASTPLKTTMHEWKADLSDLERRIAFGAGYDPKEVARLAAQLSDGAQTLGARIRSASARAQDFKARLMQLATDAQALGAASSRDAANGKYSSLRSDCVSCHHIYAN